MTTRFQVSVDAASWSTLRVTGYTASADGSINSGEGKLLKPGESEYFTVCDGKAFSIEELKSEITEAATRESVAKEPQAPEETLSPHEVYAQSIREGE